MNSNMINILMLKLAVPTEDRRRRRLGRRYVFRRLLGMLIDAQ